MSNISNVLMVGALSVVAGNVYAHGNSHAESSDFAVDAVDMPDATSPVLADVVRPAPTPLLNPSVGGQWSDVYDWPLVAIHAALLPNGKVLAWDATPDDADDDPHTTDNYTTRVTLWDPIADTHTPTNNDTDTDLFCAGSAHLWDGRILFAGGDGERAGANGPLANTNIYNPVSNTWHRTENMNAPRWYSSVAALSNGEMLTLGGTYNPVPLAEVFQFDQTWRPLAGDIPQLLNEDYQWIQQTPEGSVLYFGPSNLLVDIETAGSGEFTTQTSRDSVEDRDYGSYAMFDVGKILVAGGEQGQSSSVIIDTETRQTVDTNPLTYGRRQHNLTILADGSVLATGGNSDGARFYSPTAPVMQPEIWNPETGLWTVQNTIPTDRQYHSIALLLPDGQVLSAGGGICGDCYRLGYEERNGEIFTPPYLFNADGSLATRPRLGLLAEAFDYAEQFSVVVSSSTDITKAHLIKLGSVTHSENQDQRLVPLSFSVSSGNLSLQMPASRHVAPPGHYMLFVVDRDGVPSESAIVKLGQPLVSSDQLTRSTLEVNAWDTYETNTVDGAATINLNAASGTQLFVSAVKPVRSPQQTDIVCSATADASGNAQCVLNNVSGRQLHLSVTGSVRTDYSFIYSQSAIATTPITPATPTNESDPNTSVETDNNGGVASVTGGNTDAALVTVPATGSSGVRTGVGSVTLISVLMLVFYGQIRRFSHRNRRV